MSEETKKLMAEYQRRFNDSFPTIPLAWSRSETELQGIMQHCISEGKNVYEMGYLTEDPDVEY